MAAQMMADAAKKYGVFKTEVDAYDAATKLGDTLFVVRYGSGWILM